MKNIEEKIIKDKRNIFRLKKLKKETNETERSCNIYIIFAIIRL